MKQPRRCQRLTRYSAAYATLVEVVVAQAALKKDLISKDEFEKAELFSRELKSLIDVDAFDRLD